MWDTNGAKYERWLYNLNRVRKKSGKKYKKAKETYINILRKEDKNWETKWTVDAKAKAAARLKKMGISLSALKAYTEEKWLKDLASKIAA